MTLSYLVDGLIILLLGVAIGYAYVTLDLQGYRTGSLNETLLTIDSEA